MDYLEYMDEIYNELVEEFGDEIESKNNQRQLIPRFFGAGVIHRVIFKSVDNSTACRLDFLALICYTSSIKN